MKKVLLSFSLLLGALGASRAAVLTLNNNTPTPGQYTTFAAAQTAAAAGDTILVQGSPTSYGDITISKRLALIGQGHKPNTSLGVGATFSNITISSNLTGVRIYGIKAGIITGNDPAGSGMLNVDSLTIENVYLQNVLVVGTDCNTIVVRGCVIDGVISLNNKNVDGVIIENNYFSGITYGGYFLTGWGGTGAKLVTNNIFAYSGGGYLVNGNINNTIFQNNIFYGVTANFVGGSGVQTDCLYVNNLSFGHTNNNTLPPTGQGGSNNLVNVDPKSSTFSCQRRAPRFLTRAITAYRPIRPAKAPALAARTSAYTSRILNFP